MLLVHAVAATRLLDVIVQADNVYACRRRADLSRARRAEPLFVRAGGNTAAERMRGKIPPLPFVLDFCEARSR